MSDSTFNLDQPQNPGNIEKVLESITAAKQSLHKNNESLFKLRDDSFQKRRLIAQKKKELSNAHDKIKNVIADELDNRGKPKFSNEVKRQAEFMMRSASDGTCRTLEDQIDKLMIASAELDNKLSDLTFTQEILLLDYKLGLELLKVFGKHLGV